MLQQRQTASRPTGGDLPEAPVRGNRLFIAADHGFAWLDGWIGRWVPAELNPLGQSARVANFALLMTVLSGVGLLLWYSPGGQTAHASILAMEEGALSSWVRALHRYSADLVILMVLIHAIRVFFARKFTGARWLPWVTGILLAVLIWTIGWTGHWLVWDQSAQYVAITTARLLDHVPIFGEPLSRLFVSNESVPGLIFFVVFFLHMLLPLMVGIGLAIHVSRLSHFRLLPSRSLAAILVVALAIAAALIPSPLAPAADLTLKPETLTVDGWYLTPLALALRMQDPGLLLAIVLAIAGCLAVPWLFGRTSSPQHKTATSSPAGRQPIVDTARCHACTQCFQDCPYDAIQMLPRPEHPRYKTAAWVDPSRCVSCFVCIGSCDSTAMSLPWFGTRSEEDRIVKEARQAQPGAAGRWIALIATDIDGDPGLFDSSQWHRRLPGWQIQPVPTASWVRPHLIERLLKESVDGVIIVRDNRRESPARAGNQWVEHRLAGQRKPLFRPHLATSTAHRVIDFNPADPNALTAAAAAFRHDTGANPVPPVNRPRAIAIAAAISILLIGIVVAFSDISVRNPSPAGPELLFSFKTTTAEEQPSTATDQPDPSRPIHMQGRDTSRSRRQDLTVTLTVGEHTTRETFRPKGINRNGPTIGTLRAPLDPGDNAITIVLTTQDTPPIEWSTTLNGQQRHITVITFDDTHAFKHIKP